MVFTAFCLLTHITMSQQANNALLALLLKAYNRPVMDFIHFPEVILIGRQRIEPEAFGELLSNGYLQQVHHDNFGRIYTLTDKALSLLHQSLHGSRSKRKRQVEAPVQGSFSFV